MVTLLSPLARADVTLPNGTPDPANVNLYAWWRADAGVNQARGMPVDGAAVVRWEDSSNKNRDLTRVSTNTAARPTFRATLASGDPSVDFDGNDYIWAANQVGFLSGRHPDEPRRLGEPIGFDSGDLHLQFRRAGRVCQWPSIRHWCGGDAEHVGDHPGYPVQLEQLPVGVHLRSAHLRQGAQRG